MANELTLVDNKQIAELQSWWQDEEAAQQLSLKHWGGDGGGSIASASFSMNDGENAIDDDALASESTTSTAINKITTTIAQLGVGDFNPGYGHTPYYFFNGLIFHLLRDGCAFIIRTKNGFAVRTKAEVKVKPNKLNGDLLAYKIGKDIYPQKDVLHLKDIIDSTPEGGSRVQNAKPLIMAKIAAMKLLTVNFNRSTNMKHLVSLDQNMSFEQEKRLMDQMAGSKLSGRGEQFLIMKGAKISAITGIKPTDLDLRETIAMLQYEIAGMLGVPPSMIGVKTDEKYANAKQRNISFYRDTINPILINMTQGFKLRFGTDLEFDTSDLLAGDVDAQSIRANNEYNAGTATLNEARAIQGKPPVEGGDVFKPTTGGSSTSLPEDEDDARSEPRTGDDE